MIKESGAKDNEHKSGLVLRGLSENTAKIKIQMLKLWTRTRKDDTLHRLIATEMKFTAANLRLRSHNIEKVSSN